MFVKALLAVFVAATFTASAQYQIQRPALVVGIVIDQMRNEYIYRYWDRFGNGGFRRLVTQGFYFRNTVYNFIPTYTAPGHSSIFTGATPRVHGIIGNEWFSREENKLISCVYDRNALPVGTSAEKGKMSPRLLLTNTIGDELKLFSSNRSKVYAVSLKDRGAVLPGGHSANGAFWLEANGDFVSSSWYMKELPQWLKAFNGKELPGNYLAKGWNPLYPLNSYTSSIADDNAYENAFGRPKPTFPYNYQQAIDASKWNEVQYTPYGNSIVKDLAIACLLGEQLGKRNETDMLCISFSSTDIIGHEMGPRAVETEDMYLRLDKDIEELLNTLDNEIGKNNYLLFLTSDHGAADVPAHLIDQRIPAGHLFRGNIKKQLREFMQRQHGDSLIISSVSNEQVYIDELRLIQRQMDIRDIEQETCRELMRIEGVAEAYPSEALRNGAFSEPDTRALLLNGFNHQRSGNVAYLMRPHFMDHGRRGTSHGTGYSYDTHVPLLFFGAGIKNGETFEYVAITQIAPTVTELLRIGRPAGSQGKPLNDHFK
jgi:predicted AlkP superfamily pyrophosphatase or phosphodiesterase